MNSIFLRILVVMAVLNFSGAPVMAENPCTSLGQGKSVEKTDNVIAQFQAWSVFVETNPDECFAVANPVNTTKLITRGLNNDQKWATDGSNKPSAAPAICCCDVSAIKIPFSLTRCLISLLAVRQKCDKAAVKPPAIPAL